MNSSFFFFFAGYGKNHLGHRKKIVGKKRPYGVITGLSAKKAMGSHKGISPLNRQPLSEKVINVFPMVCVTALGVALTPQKEQFRNETRRLLKYIPVCLFYAVQASDAVFCEMGDVLAKLLFVLKGMVNDKV